MFEPHLRESVKSEILPAFSSLKLHLRNIRSTYILTAKHTTSLCKYMFHNHLEFRFCLFLVSLSCLYIKVKCEWNVTNRNTFKTWGGWTTQLIALDMMNKGLLVVRPFLQKPQSFPELSVPGSPTSSQIHLCYVSVQKVEVRESSVKDVKNVISFELIKPNCTVHWQGMFQFCKSQIDW